MLSTIAHVGAAGAWLGGLTVVLVVVLAFVSVIVIVATGLVESMRQVGSVDALTTTTYGRLLIAEVVIVAVLVAFGGLNRRWHARGSTTAGSVDAGLLSLRRRMVLETLGAIVVVAVTSLLVNAAPARKTVSRPVDKTLRAQTILIDVTFEPARKGRNEIHLYALTKAGLPQKVYAISATMALPSAGVEPISLKLLRAGPNHFQVLGADLPVAGTWRLTVQVQLDEFTEESATGATRIR